MHKFISILLFLKSNECSILLLISFDTFNISIWSKKCGKCLLFVVSFRDIFYIYHITSLSLIIMCMMMRLWLRWRRWGILFLGKLIIDRTISLRLLIRLWKLIHLLLLLWKWTTWWWWRWRYKFSAIWQFYKYWSRWQMGLLGWKLRGRLWFFIILIIW